jgi:uncharacterized protein
MVDPSQLDDGTRTYFTEGELRLIHRKTRGPACAGVPGTSRSFARADSEPGVPGEMMTLEIPLLPTAARLARGHRLRLSFAGTDAGTFPLLAGAPPQWTVRFGGESPSAAYVPLRDWDVDDVGAATPGIGG